MAQSSRKVGTLIKSSFGLQIAVCCSDNAEVVCKKNNLTFSELLRPYSLLGNKVQLKDAQGHSYTASNIHVKFSEPQNEPVPDSKLRMTLGEVVGNTTSQPTAMITTGDIRTNATAPWFDVYRDTFLDHFKQSDHETIKHYVAVVFVVASSHMDPLGVFSQLVTKQKQSEQAKHPKWLSPHVYHYYVLLHDVSEGNESRAKESFAKVQALYGSPNSHLLQLNSQAPGTPDKHSTPDLYLPFMRATQQDMDEVDGGFKWKRRFKSKNKAKKDTSKTTAVPNNTHQSGSDSSPEFIKPNVREEAKLFDLDPLNSPTLDANQSSIVAPGNDPLSQLAGSPDNQEEEERLSNSSTPPSEDNSVSNLLRQYGQCLSQEDHNNLQAFVQEMVGKRLLSHLNDFLKTLNDTVVKQRSVRRSISYMSNRFLKMFQGPNNVVSDDPNYANNSIEVLQRQLGDIAFLLQNYDLAFHSYHQVKKDFQGASAWLHYAGAVEMCAMSAYMMSSTKREVVSYLEEASSVYNLSCKAPYYAHRASLLLSEILKERGLYRDLTQLYIRMTSEDADLRSAVCVEQAAHSFLRVQPSMIRKYALHLILAGHRYARSAQKVHSTRVYKQALEVYDGKGWTLAEDYIHFSLARHTFSLHRLNDAKLAFEQLLSHESSVSVSQQLLNLKDYIYVHNQLLESSDEPSPMDQVDLATQTHVDGLPLLPVPFVQSQLTRVTFATAPTKGNLAQPLRLSKNSPTKPRSSSFNTSSQMLVDSNILVEEMNAKARSTSFNLSPEVSLSSTSLSQHLKQLESTSGSSSNSLIIGASDYDPGRGDSGSKQWEELEMKASVGISGVQHENFQPSTLVMDHSTDNTKMPICVVNESVAVGLILANPLRIPLVMAKLSLVWRFNPFTTKAGNPAPFPANQPAAESEVISSLVLQPEEERMVTLYITPFREGELKVVGFVYNLCVDASQQKLSNPPITSTSSRSTLLSMTVSSRDSLYQVHLGDGIQAILAEGVRGVVQMDVHGPRLNNTKVEKTSVVYGKDLRLNWIVTSPMPKLVANLSNLPSSVISGEVRRVGMEVYNCGQVALNSLRLTSSFGQLLLLEQDLSFETKERPIYPSSLLSPVSLSPPPSLPNPSHLHSGSFGCIELPLSHGRLDPGEGVKAKLILQVSQSSSLLKSGGELPWDILFYYEPALISANSRLSHRVMRHTYTMQARECPHFKATAVHGQLPGSTSSIGVERFDMNRVVITVESENRCHLSDRSAVELRILQISCASAKWKVNKMDRGQGTLCLLPSESGVVQLKASRLEQPLKKLLCYSDIPLGPTMIPSCGFPTGELFRGSAAHRALRMDKDSPPPSLLSAGSRQDRTPPVEEIALIIFWQALVPSGTDTLFSYGHHSFTVPLPQSMSVLMEPHSSQPPSPYDLVKFYLEHPVSKKFSKVFNEQSTVMSLCQVPVQVVLQNCCHQKVKAMVELLQPKDGGHHDTKSSRQPHQEPSFYWSGGTCRRHVLLDANSTRTLTVFANFGRPGVYNLNTLRVLVARGESSNYHVQRWQRTSYITID